MKVMNDDECNASLRKFLWSEEPTNRQLPQSVLDQIQEETQKEEINHPFHYTQGGIEVIDFIKAWNFDYLEGNIIKYVSRYRYKGNRVNDLLKARQYLDWLIEREKTEEDIPF